MVKLEQALILDPPLELHFKAPFKELTTSFLKLTNPTDQYICFKLKTTAPKTYCVRPNSGIIPPKEHVSVAVMLQPIDLDSADKSKHKFMVQSMFAPHGDVNLEALWKDTPAENFMNSKLRCVFDISEQNSQVAVDGDDVKQETMSVSEILTEVRMSPAKDTHTNADMEKLEEDNKLLKTVLMKVRQENSQLKLPMACSPTLLLMTIFCCCLQVDLVKKNACAGGFLEAVEFLKAKHMHHLGDIQCYPHILQFLPKITLV